MRRLFLMAVPMALVLAACTVPSAGPTAGTGSSATSSAGATAGPGQPPSSAPASGNVQGSGKPRGEAPPAGDDEPGRFSYRCTSLDASPEVQLSSLAEVWAATNYTRLDSCEVAFAADGPFEPTPREAEAISTAGAQGGTADDALATMLDVLRLCTRISDETGPGGFAEAGRGPLLAAAEFCPDAPQGKILAAWAEGGRVGDGSYVAGEDVEPGELQLVKPSDAGGGCTWSVTAADGSVVASGSLIEAGTTVEVQPGQKFTSDKCGIWGKMY
ncbi:hypothetical protein J2790_000952 [Paenarthrobacter nicotinovorans]|uniref:Lipoprotein n=1 Tax=Paenarthrobacter nicotinovorans TaxID=29320 RepID=A0ABV0GVA4_PAENI|nr:MULTISPECIES: hypothetical protein [Micrococcaceae]MDR6435831.1 hypothetical protein [Paenarthrobacter nicotinovorans]BCW59436.1 hypothetical protein StoSoilB20_27830 [Arthrobacter sp. StoSoilB20]SCZ50849.1 hypothetical protein SAMN02799638_00691 [Arthrobacter sp. UNCCL28]